MIRILFPFVGDTIGGSHVSAIHLIEALPKNDYVPIVVLHRDGPLARHLATLKIPYEMLESVAPIETPGLVSQVTGMVARARPLVRFLRNRDIDVVHTNDIRMHMTWAFATCMGRRKHIWHQRSATDSRRLGMYARLSARVITISHHCKAFLNPGIGSRARVVYDPVSGMVDAPTRRAVRHMIQTSTGHRNAAFIIGYVGNLTRQKCPLDFVEAVALLVKRLDDERPGGKKPGNRVCAVMLGEHRVGQSGLYRDVCSRITHHGLDECVFLVGPKYPVEPWLRGCDLLLAPAVNEGLGRTLIEAALAGTPVVATDDGGHREAVKNGVTGCLVPKHDPSAMADCAAALLRDPSRRGEIARQAKQQARARFDPGDHMRAITGIYDSLYDDPYDGVGAQPGA